MYIEFAASVIFIINLNDRMKLYSDEKFYFGTNKFKEIFKRWYIYLLTVHSYILWIFRYSETFTKGYNIYEDNLLITTSQSLDINSFLNVIVKSFINDLNGKQIQTFLYCLSCFNCPVIWNGFIVHKYFLHLFVSALHFFYKFCTSSGSHH